VGSRPVLDVLVETNWILDVALQQDDASVELFRQSQARRARLHLPTFCVAEAVKSVETKQNDLKRLINDQLPRLQRELSRSPSTRDTGAPIEQLIDALARAHDAITTQFWLILRDIVATTALIPPRPETIELTAAIQDLLNLSPGDASVLATAILSCRDDVCRVFMSRDGDFSDEVVKDYMAREGLTFYPNAESIVGPLRRE